MKVPPCLSFYRITAVYIAVALTVIVVLLALDLHVHTTEAPPACRSVEPERNQP